MNTQMTTATDIAYKAVGDYLLPVIALPESSGPIGHFGRLRKAFLRENRPLIFQTMLLNGTLDTHLQEISETAEKRLEQMMQELMKTENVTEELKASDPMRWTGLMNSLKAQAEEILLAELIYS